MKMTGKENGRLRDERESELHEDRYRVYWYIKGGYESRRAIGCGRLTEQIIQETATI